jgi:hypothetical protein
VHYRCKQPVIKFDIWYWSRTTVVKNCGLTGYSFMFIYLFIYLSLHPSIHAPIHAPIHPSIHLPTYLPTCLPARPPARSFIQLILKSVRRAKTGLIWLRAGKSGGLFLNTRRAVFEHYKTFELRKTPGGGGFLTNWGTVNFSRSTVEDWERRDCPCACFLGAVIVVVL